MILTKPKSISAGPSDGTGAVSYTHLADYDYYNNAEQEHPSTEE